MPIDFSLLGNPQQKGGVVAQIPVNQAPNPIDAGIGGLMSGMAQGQQMQLQAAQTQELQAKAAKEQAAARAQLEIQKAHQEGGVPAMLDAMDKYDIKTSTETRKALQEIQNGKATYDKTIAETAQTEQATKTSKALADTYPSVSGLNKANTAKAEGEASKLALANSDEFLDKNAGAFHAADNAYKQALAKDPDPVKAALAANQVLQIKQAALPKYMFDVIPVPREYSPNNLFISNLAGADAHDRLLEKETNSKATPLMKNSQEIARLTEKQKTTGLTPEEITTLEKMNLSANKQTVNNPVQQINISTTTDRLKDTGKNANIATQTLSTLDQMEKLNDSAFAGRGSDVELKAKQFLEFIGMPPAKGTAATEAFNSIVRNAQLNAQTLLKGSSSDRDMQIVSETSPQLFNTKTGRDLMISSGKYKATMDQQYNSFLNAYQAKHEGSLEGADEQWNRFKQSRSDFDAKTLKFNSKGVSKQSWAPYLDQATSSTKEINGATYIQQNGKWYQQ